MENNETPQDQIELTEEQQQSKRESSFAIAGFVCSLIGVFIPIIIPSILGIIFSAIGFKSRQKGLAIAGLVVSIISIIFVLVSVIVIFPSLSVARIKAKQAAFQAEVRGAAASFVLSCDDGTLKNSSVWSEYSHNVKWSEADILSEDCSNGAGEFLVEHIIPIDSDVSCIATIESGIASFDCSTI